MTLFLFSTFFGFFFFNLKGWFLNFWSFSGFFSCGAWPKFSNVYDGISSFSLQRDGNLWSALDFEISNTSELEFGSYILWPVHVPFNVLLLHYYMSNFAASLISLLGCV